MPRKTVIPEGPLSDCVVSASGSLNRTTREVRSVVESAGGQFSSTITTQVTHLVATEEDFEKDSAKIKSAKKNKIPIVSEDWLDEIENNGIRPDETKYTIGSVEKRAKSSKKRKVVQEEDDDDDLIDEEELQKQKMIRERDLREYYLGSLSSLIDDKLFSDLIFVVPQDASNPHGATHKIHAHRAIMASNSAVLKAMIDKSNKKEGNCVVVEIADVSYDLFNSFMEVSYTGRVKNMKAQHALALIDLCEKYGMNSFAEYLKFTVSTPENVCLLFDAAVQNNNTQIQKWCLAVINKFTERVVVTSSFRELSEQAMKIILDSNSLAVEEVVLFERLIEWADTQIEKRIKDNRMELENNNNIDNVATDATVQAKARAEVLAPVMDKLRFPMMHGEELHSVVEPYGVVPDNLLLEAYRYNASPKTFDEKTLDSPRFKARSILGPKWLSAGHANALRKFVGSGKLKLVYLGSKDGMSNAIWRQKVSGIAGTVCVFKTTNGYIFGGYTSLVWSGRGNYAPDSKAFLFSLAEPTKSRKPEKILQIGGTHQNAVYDINGYGPTWGSGHDLHTNLDTKNGYSQLGYAFVCPPGASQQTYMAGQYNNWVIEDVVIFSTD